MDYKKIGEFIQIRRKELGLTQKQLGEKLNVTDKAVSKWETGQGCPDVSILGELSEALDVGIGEILNGEYNETLKDNSEFIMNAVDYSKKVTENNIYDKIRKILYVILILITLYMTFMSVRQFIYLSDGIEFKSDMHDDVHKEFEKLKENVQIIKENGYLVYEDSVSDYHFDYAENMEYLISKLKYSKLFDDNTVEIKNSELLNIYVLIRNIHNTDIYCLNRLKTLDENNAKYYDLANTSQYINFYSYFIVDENGNYFGNSMYNDNGIEVYYSDKLYNYSEVKDNTELFNQYYKELGIKLTKLNKTLEFIIEVGENNENN